MKKFIFLALAVAAFAGKARAQSEFTRTPQGAQYRIVSPKTGDRIKLEDVISFNMIQKTEKDSVLFSTYTQGRPIQIQVKPSQNIGDLMYVFPLLTVKDSVIVRVPADSVFKGHEEARPPFLPSGSLLIFVMKMERVQSMNEAIAERNAALAAQKSAMDRMKTDELANLDKYVADHKLNVKTTASGLRYEITQTTTKPKITRGDTLLVNYAGRTTNDKLFDSSVESIAKEGGLVQPGRNYEPIKFPVGEGNVIKGWDEGLQLLSEGAKAIFVIPSNLGYGEQGGGAAIPPYSTLVFDVEVVKVIKGKAKTAAKKPAAGTPAAKPATTPAKKPATAPAKKPVVKK
ncbi:FKBP-type peptidyl-prolyl cis-trans isomerase [Mucilaginibacter myungsuensis]|uniref:peptidylprolyl isomerase n=1 Tax=Mucilaginibacter myungsuensis TaxID=649104 RepID=A0A929PWI8_9SPHI|nr:FKBP-type peptidyl-prolyl cis-trans isomerase [Mucilaginibacter myungsuensis]MBE9661400.1 FKBP-type peptidyl-prolyl cis-trans isomerase [Mucilaginibacter myungsuensis]MDN3597543.1 FKBP-type peptidyl-prolyl cis-trans isomerase [Mucilaginibacter myungsuensis]